MRLQHRQFSKFKELSSLTHRNSRIFFFVKFRLLRSSLNCMTMQFDALVTFKLLCVREFCGNNALTHPTHCVLPRKVCGAEWGKGRRWCVSSLTINCICASITGCFDSAHNCWHLVLYLSIRTTFVIEFGS